MMLLLDLLQHVTIVLPQARGEGLLEDYSDCFRCAPHRLGVFGWFNHLNFVWSLKNYGIAK